MCLAHSPDLCQILTFRKLKLLKNAINLLASDLIYTSFVHSAGYALFGLEIALTTGLAARRKFIQYHFQHSLGTDTVSAGLTTRQKTAYVVRWTLQNSKN